MPSLTPSPVSRIEVISVGARQRWTLDRKRALVAETFEPGAKVSAVARRHGVASSLLFAWRKQWREENGLPGPAAAKAPAPCFLPLAIAAETSAATLELEMTGGVRLRVTGKVDADLVVAVVKALSRR